MSAPSLLETIGELRDLLLDVEREANDTGYGFFVGGDPRTFSPDEESCSAEEIARWKEDCARAERGEPLAVTPGCHARKPGYGVGTYTMENPTCQDWAERLRRHIAQLEGYLADRQTFDPTEDA